MWERRRSQHRPSGANVGAAEIAASPERSECGSGFSRDRQPVESDTADDRRTADRMRDLGLVEAGAREAPQGFAGAAATFAAASRSASQRAIAIMLSKLPAARPSTRYLPATTIDGVLPMP